MVAVPIAVGVVAPVDLPGEQARRHDVEAGVAALVQQDPEDVPPAVEREADQAKDAVA